MANDGSMPIPVRPGSSGSILLWWSLRRSSRVVHTWPCQPMYWRSSEQMTQEAGGEGDSSYWTPQVVQMNFAMWERYTHRGG